MIPGSLRTYASRHGYAIRRTREIAGVETFMVVDLNSNTVASSTRLEADQLHAELSVLAGPGVAP